ncbi:MAG: M28 family peptidase, partial [Vicinamibacterales bacterium]|nr:M28 family peptidase [Vicinamibacterales bacterium]
GISIAAISVTDQVAHRWLTESGRKLRRLQFALDGGKPVMGFELQDVGLSATIDIRQEKRTGRNVLGRLRGAAASDGPIVLVGAHVDHLGRGVGSSSLAKTKDANAVHYGADDNASGVAAMLEVARVLADRARRGAVSLRRDVVFAAWSGEELGLLGSGHFARTFSESGDESANLYPAIAANVNLDMIGRYRNGLTLHGIGSSSVWPTLIEQANAPIGLRIIPQDDSFVPTDATSFFVKGVPVLSAFTGAHEDYHTPRDTPDRIDYPATQRITRFVARVVEALAAAEDVPDYVAATRPRPGASRAGLRAYLGTIPDYSQSDAKGVKISGVSSGGPADKAGLKGADVVVELAGRRIENIYDYTYAIEALKIGGQVDIIVVRDGRRLKLKIVPESRE